jgi:hypothetical protein
MRVCLRIFSALAIAGALVWGAAGGPAAAAGMLGKLRAGAAASELTPFEQVRFRRRAIRSVSRASPRRGIRFNRLPLVRRFQVTRRRPLRRFGRRFRARFGRGGRGGNGVPYYIPNCRYLAGCPCRYLTSC